MKRMIVLILTILLGVNSLVAQEIVPAVESPKEEKKQKASSMEDTVKHVSAEPVDPYKIEIDGLRCEIEELKKENEVLKAENSRLKQQPRLTAAEKYLIDSLCSNLPIHEARDFVCRAIMESPLLDAYNPDNIKYSLQLSRTIGLDKATHEYHYIYNIYIDLLLNYKDYTKEIVDVLDLTIGRFDMPGFDADFELRNFNSRIEKSSYYKVRGKGDKYAGNRKIFYIDFQISQIQQLLRDKNKCKQQSFVEIRNFLVKWM